MPGKLDNLVKSWVNRTRKIIGWNSEKNSKIGFRTSFFRYLMNRYRVSESKDIFNASRRT